MKQFLKKKWFFVAKKKLENNDYLNYTFPSYNVNIKLGNRLC